MYNCYSQPYYDKYLYYRGEANQTARIACDYIDSVIKDDAEKYTEQLRWSIWHTYKPGDIFENKHENQHISQA